MFGIENVREYVRKFECELMSNEYKNAKSEIKIKCKCGNVFETSYNCFRISKLKACKECVGKHISTNKTLSYEYVKRYIETNSKCLLLSKEYISSDKKLKIKCHCGNKFEQSFDVFRNGKHKQCPKCSNDMNTINQRHTQQEAEELALENGNKMIGKYTNYHTKTIFLCECGEKINTTLATVTTNKNVKCRKCLDCKLREERKYSYEYIDKYIKNKGCSLLEGEYENNTSKLTIRCNCGESFITDFATFRTGKQFCDGCGRRISRGERAVIETLKEMNIEFIREYKFSDCRVKRELPFDFFLPTYNTCIEYQGMQHYKEGRWKNGRSLEEQKEYDKVKFEYCQNNNIKLIAIPYWTKKENIRRFIENRLSV